MNHYIKNNEILKSLISVLKSNYEEYNFVFDNNGIVFEANFAYDRKSIK